MNTPQCYVTRTLPALVFLGSSSAPTPTFPDTIKTRTQQLVQKIVKNTVEVLHSVQHDIPVAAE